MGMLSLVWFNRPLFPIEVIFNNLAPDSVRPKVARQESAFQKVVRAEGDKNTPTRKGTIWNEGEM